MDIYSLDPSGTGLSPSLAKIDEDLAEVNFDAGSEFNLHFFDTPEDSNTQSGFSDHESSESPARDTPPSPVCNSTRAGLGMLPGSRQHGNGSNPTGGGLVSAIGSGNCVLISSTAHTVAERTKVSSSSYDGAVQRSCTGVRTGKIKYLNVMCEK
uniref:Uncharacterized protein n=1 Tax=Anopheles minimus TaxID=112268 RepID=A0A182WBT4_9DIPT